MMLHDREPFFPSLLNKPLVNLGTNATLVKTNKLDERHKFLLLLVRFGYNFNESQAERNQWAKVKRQWYKSISKSKIDSRVVISRFLTNFKMYDSNSSRFFYYNHYCAITQELITLIIFRKSAEHS